MNKWLLCLCGVLVGWMAACSSDLPPIEGSPDCDPIHLGRCAMPWPSNLYLEDDASRVTGSTLNFGSNSLDLNTFGDGLVPEPWRALDGYGVGTAVLVSFPNVDTAGMASEGDMGRSLAADSPILWLELDAGGQVVNRVPHWAELDSNSSDPAEQTMFVRPAVILKEGTRYIVAFRNLHDTQGNPILPTEAFVRLRDNTTSGDGQLAPRQARFDTMFAALEADGVARDELVLAWDFVTASCQALHGPMLDVRDQGLAAAGAQGPPLTITSVITFTPQQNADIAFELEGTFEAPNFLALDTILGYESERLSRDGNDNLVQNATRVVTFWVRIPRSAIDGSNTPHDLMLYGHGLLGSGTQVRGGHNSRIANMHNMIPFAVDLLGMSEANQVDAIQALNNPSRFPFMSEQLHQGLFHYILAARTMRERLQSLVDTLPETQGLGITVNSTPGALYYSGISQGGIFGGSFMALTPDITYGHLGVPGNNYTTLLDRSVDFDQFAMIMRMSYTNPIDQTIVVQLMGSLWEMTDPVSYLRHISAEPFPGNDPHYVLLAPAKGDYQVAVITNENLARSGVGVSILENYGADVWDVTPATYPHTGSGVVLYDFGNAWPPFGNRPPSDPAGDPHGKPRREDHHNQQMVDFFRTGQIIDVCGGDGCTPN